MDTREMMALRDVLKEVEVDLDNIFLDPNNPRFINEKSHLADDKLVTDAGIQQLVRAQLIKEFGVEKLSSSMRVNGYLPIDRIVIRSLSHDESKYVVLEGNRRVCAAKMLKEAIMSDACYASESVANSVQRIPCLEYLGTDTDAAWIFQGLRHISGISDWPAYNKARLLVEQMQKEGLTLTQAGERFGLTGFGAGQWARGYYAYEQALQESDYVHELASEAYPYFQELFGRSNGPIREWLGWDNDNWKFKDIMRFNEFIGWLYPRDNELDRPEEQGNFDGRYIKVRDDIRRLSILLAEEPELFEKFRREWDVERAYAEAMTRKYEREVVNTEKSLFDCLQDSRRCLEDVPFRLMQNEEFKTKLKAIIGQLKEAIDSLNL